MTEDSPADFWEDRYAQSDRVWSGRANQVLVDLVADWQPGSALDLGCGEGADVVWLASRGWQALGIDVSKTAIVRGRDAAVERDLADQAMFEVVDLTSWAPTQSFDLVTAFFLQSPVNLPRADALRTASTAVDPGGRMLLVSHAQMPPWANAHAHADLLHPEEELAQLALSSDQWSEELVEVRDRAAVGPNGESVTLSDAVILLRRS